MIQSLDNDTIVAIATAPGRGGIGVIRLSGDDLSSFAIALLGEQPKPRTATFSSFYNKDKHALDQGIALFFPAPNSFTGETVLELQAHGGPVVLDMLLQRCIDLGARLARPGEFSERAFINEKIDLTQAEAIADLIDASSEQAALGALRSLQGEFSEQIHRLVEETIHLRMFVEAAIDFPEEEVDFLSGDKVAAQLQDLLTRTQTILSKTQQGALLQEGMTIVLAGKPNAGKSSLLNALSGKDSAIVTDIAGTTRDTLKERINLDGMPVHIIDTAGLRESSDVVEQEGIRRALKEIETADRILYIIDSSEPFPLNDQSAWLNDDVLKQGHIDQSKLTFILNKTDISGISIADISLPDNIEVLAISAKNNQGIDQLTEHLKHCMSFKGAAEGLFTARRRHIDALKQTESFLCQAQSQISANTSGELLAEDLRLAQEALSSITGEFSSDDLLGEIFAGFCIGK